MCIVSEAGTKPQENGLVIYIFLDVHKGKKGIKVEALNIF